MTVDVELLKDASDNSKSLEKACELGSFELVKSLISSKTDPNKVNEETGGSVLHVLVNTENVSMRTVMICDVLLKAKADPGLKDTNNNRPFDILKERKSTPRGITAELMKLLNQETASPPRSPTKAMERSESLKKLLEFSPLRSPRKAPVNENPIQSPEPPKSPQSPPRTHTPAQRVKSPQTPRSPPTPKLSRMLELETENEKLRAENSALKDELKRFRNTMTKLNARQQLKELYARLLQLESIETTLEQLTHLKD